MVLEILVNIVCEALCLIEDQLILSQPLLRDCLTYGVIAAEKHTQLLAIETEKCFYQANVKFMSLIVERIEEDNKYFVPTRHFSIFLTILERHQLSLLSVWKHLLLQCATDRSLHSQHLYDHFNDLIKEGRQLLGQQMHRLGYPVSQTTIKILHNIGHLNMKRKCPKPTIQLTPLPLQIILGWRGSHYPVSHTISNVIYIQGKPLFNKGVKRSMGLITSSWDGESDFQSAYMDCTQLNNQGAILEPISTDSFEKTTVKEMICLTRGIIQSLMPVLNLYQHQLHRLDVNITYGKNQTKLSGQCTQNKTGVNLIEIFPHNNCDWFDFVDTVLHELSHALQDYSTEEDHACDWEKIFGSLLLIAHYYESETLKKLRHLGWLKMVARFISKYKFLKSI